MPEPTQDQPQSPQGRPSEADPHSEAAFAEFGDGALSVDGDATPDSADDSTSLVEQLRAQVEEAKDRCLRSQAELDNFRKRASRELADQRKYAHLDLIRDALPVLDNMQRAIAAAEKSADAGALLEGVKMVANSLEAVLMRHSCIRIQALHQPFDPAFHEAIGQQPSKDHPPQTVLLVAQEGYVLHDRVVRPAQVIISVAAD